MNTVDLAAILEDDWDRQLFRGPKSVAANTGWLTFHVLRSKGSRSGFPDRTCVRERILFAELKRERTKPTPDQIEWLDRLSAAGGECYVWRPSDLEEIGLILGKRWKFDPVTHSLERKEAFLLPKSIWLPKVGRRDSVEKPPRLSQQALPVDI